MMQLGDEDAFTMLYRRRQGGIYRFVLEMSGSASLAEDATQEVFMALIRDNRGYDPSRGSLGAYLLGMARHHALRLIKRDRTYVSISQTWDGSGDSERFAPLSPENPHSEMSRRESIHWVQQAILSLPEHEAIHLLSSILVKFIFKILKEKTPFPLESYRKILKEYKSRNPKKINQLVEDIQFDERVE